MKFDTDQDDLQHLRDMHACMHLSLCARVFVLGGGYPARPHMYPSIQKTTYVHTQVGQFLEEAGTALGAPVAISGFLRLKCGEGE